MAALEPAEVARLDRNYYASWPDRGRATFLGLDASAQAIRYAKDVGLIEDGVVQLTDPVSKFVPSMKDVKVVSNAGEVAPGRAPTVQDLLRHTAGLAYGEITRNETVKAGLVIKF